VRQIEISEALFAVSLASDLLNFDEPMPEPKIHNRQKLDACIQQPFATYGGKYLYRTTAHKAAVMFYRIIKNHPLQNGNKRTAVVVTMLFLYKNKKMFDLTPNELYDLACDVAASSADNSDKIIFELKNNFNSTIVALDPLYL
jgi:death on curing protein